MKKYVMIFILLLLLLLSACFRIDNSTDKVVNSPHSKSAVHTNGVKDPIDIKRNTEEILDYATYQRLYEGFSNEVKIDGYHFRGSSGGIDAIRVDENLTFSKRGWLTTSGELSPLEPTQEMYYYENEDENRLLTITIAYTESYIGSDMVFYNVSHGYDINKELANNEIIALSYKNLIINILQTTSNDLEMDDTQNAAASIIEYLEKY
ncbi:hypothetical protein [Lentibacillus saliphilus]|uniref:hypothetical protein n=1 Tax=Lentibacillus saliphilus TaxID=2737028 RepID=UPI001C303776|nr:hypothetical protein [Lentibacillus saliphilus]